MQFKSIWAQCPQGGEWTSSAKTPLFLHTLYVPPAGTHPTMHHAGLPPPQCKFCIPWHVLTMRSCVWEPCGCSVSPRSCSRMFPGQGVWDRKGGWTDWVLELRAPPRFKTKEVADICLSGLPVLLLFACLFLLLFVCIFESPPH